jgi:hypothetical protein
VQQQERTEKQPRLFKPKIPFFCFNFFLPGTPQEEYCPAANLGKFGKKFHPSGIHSVNPKKTNLPISE